MRCLEDPGRKVGVFLYLCIASTGMFVDSAKLLLFPAGIPP